MIYGGFMVDFWCTADPLHIPPPQQRNHFVSYFRSAGHWPGERSLGCWSACCKLQQRGVTDVSKGRGNWRLGLLPFWGQNPWCSWFGVHLVGGLEHFYFPYIGKNHPNWLIFFGGVETTNQSWLILFILMRFPGHPWPQTHGSIPPWAVGRFLAVASGAFVTRARGEAMDAGLSLFGVFMG